MRETLTQELNEGTAESELAISRFTVDGSERLEQHLAKICAEVCAGVQEIVSPERLDGLLLGGGYGRGEGGVLQTDDGEKPYNDLEFYVFVRGSTLVAERRFRSALHTLGHELEAYAGVEVEFKIVNRLTVKRSVPTMFFYDLVSGHHRLFGEADLLDGCDHQRIAGRIPLHEATRLLMNRCSGLLFSTERLARRVFTAEDSDFVGRNCAKAELALGDAVLVAHEMYHHSVRQRAANLRILRPAIHIPHMAELLAFHDRGTEFKLHPRVSRESRDVLQSRLEHISSIARDVFLWLEGTRLGTEFASPRAYTASELDKCPETPAWRNSLVNIRAFGLASLGEQPLRYPRCRLLETLPLLLWEPAALSDADLSLHLTRRLNQPTTDFTSAVAAYTGLWHRFQ